MWASNNQVTFPMAGLALLAITLGSPVARVALAAEISCTVTSTSRTNIASVPGFANALVELAEFACNDVGGGSVPINERVTGVASAMAEAVAEVVGQCTGEGDAAATVSGISRAEARAEAVGKASARILATSQVCEVCEAGLNAFSTAVETVAATAVAEASVMANFTFQEGDDQTFTVSDIQREVEENIIQLLATVTGEINTDSSDGCSGNAVTNSEAGDSVATCDVAISADDIIHEVDAVAAAGAAVRALGCEGGGNEAQINLVVREVASAVAQAVVQADSFCESTGGPGTIGCGLSNATITAVARATASGFAAGLVEANGDGCDCDLSAAIELQKIEEIMVTASASALAQVCTDGPGFAIATDFQFETEEAMAVAVAQFIASAITGADCSIKFTVCTDTAPCVRHLGACSGPGLEVTHTCCSADHVCASLFGGKTFRCRNRASVDAFETAEILECPK